MAESSLRNTEFYLEVAKGNIPGHSIMSGMGEWINGLVAANGEDCCRFSAVSGPAILPTPADVGEQMTVVSDDNADNGATATGVLTLRLHYIDAAGAEQTEDITMNGTTDVDTVATDIRFVNDMYSLTVGSNGVAVPALSIVKVSHWDDQAGTEGSVGWWGVLVDNT